MDEKVRISRYSVTNYLCREETSSQVDRLDRESSSIPSKYADEAEYEKGAKLLNSSLSLTNRR